MYIVSVYITLELTYVSISWYTCIHTRAEVRRIIGRDLGVGDVHYEHVKIYKGRGVRVNNYNC